MPPLALPESANAARQIYTRLTPAQRLVLALALAVAIAGVIAVVSWSSGRTYQTLYTGLSTEDAVQVTARLSTLGIRFETADNGTSIKVPADRLDAARLALAAEGLPASGSLGFEIFDRTQLGVTDFTENVNLRRALEGELARTVRSLKEVAAARVHVVMPRERPFARDEKEAKASVVLRLKAGHKLEPPSVQAIQQLVSSAVEGLKPEAVVVVDDRGVLLSRVVGQGPTGGLSGAELDEKRRFESELGGNVLAILEPLYGVGRVFARVHADLDFSVSEETAELFDPDKRAILSEQRAEERFPRLVGNGGVPGVASNLGPLAASPSPSPVPSPNDIAKLSETKNYEVSKTVRRTTLPRGRLRRLSVAVVIDSRSAVPAAVAAGSPVASPSPASAIAAVPAASPSEAKLPELARVQALVAAATGVDPARGDQLEVEVLPFELVPADPSLSGAIPDPSKWDAGRDLLRAYGRPVGIVLAILLGYLLVLRPIQREALATLRGTKSAPGTIGAGGLTPAAALVDRAESAAYIGPAILPNEVRQAVAKAVASDPAATARFIRSWLDKETQ